MTTTDPTAWPHRPRTVEEHAAAVLELLTGVRLDAETVPLVEAGGRILASDVVAAIDLPAFDNSQMDGYAVRAADLTAGTSPVTSPVRSPITLPLGPAVPAGAVPAPLQPGTAVPIMTGAMIPAGADAVVPVEETQPPLFPAWVGERHGVPGVGATVRFGPAAVTTAPGRFVRAAGSDLPRSAVALTAGTRLAPAAVGVLASLGHPQVSVRRRLRVLLYSTGSEVVDPGTDLPAGRIHDANTAILRAALTACGATVTTARLVADTPADLLAALAADLGGPADRAPDVVVTSGGISRGAFEVVKQALGERGVRFGGVAMQPGGPQGAGLLDVGGRRVPLLAFPGNPVSALVSTEMFLRPALAALLGAPARQAYRARLVDPVTPLAAKRQIRRGVIVRSTDRITAGTQDLDPRVRLVGGPSSHLLHAAATADVLVHLPVSADPLPAGSVVTVTPLD